MWFKTRYHSPAKEKEMDFVSIDDVTRNKYHLLPKEKINGVRKDGGCDSIHGITYPLRGKRMVFVSMEDVI